MSDVVQKRCGGSCKRMLPATTEFFCRNKTKQYGFDSWCKLCKQAYSKEHAEYVKAKNKEYYATHREYYQAHNRAHKRAFPEQNRARENNRRIRKKAISGSHTLQQIQEQLIRQKHKCYYCSARFQRVKGKYIYHVDHTFPLSRVAGLDIPANDISYLVLACPTCNHKKSDKFPWEFPEGGRLL